MNNKQKNKLYIKATNYYESGEFDKALNICELGMAENLKNASLINLKGLLLYLSGNLEEAVAAWKINYDYNNNSIAKSYIKDAKADVERLKNYSDSLILIKNLRIEEAIVKLNSCLESDFNLINVNMALANCYLRKAEYSKASVYIIKVLKIDRNNKDAIKIYKEIEEFSGVKLNINKKNNYINLGIIIVGIICLLGGAIGVYGLKEIDKSKASISQNEDKPKVEEIKGEELNEEEQKGETKEDSLINVEEVQRAIEIGNYDFLYEVISKTKVDSLEGVSKGIYIKAKEILQDKGVDSFYKSGMSLYEQGNFDMAKVYFIKAYEYGSNNYLYPHIIFFNGVINERLSNNNEAIVNYEKYYNEYYSGDYIEEALYKLAILYKDNDNKKSSNYAKELRNNYSKSIYNNDTISSLLESNK